VDALAPLLLPGRIIMPAPAGLPVLRAAPLLLLPAAPPQGSGLLHEPAGLPGAMPGDAAGVQQLGRGDTVTLSRCHAELLPLPS
jgi:hypothetical protein